MWLTVASNLTFNLKRVIVPNKALKYYPIVAMIASILFWKSSAIFLLVFPKNFHFSTFCTHCAREETLLTHLEKMRTWNHIQRLILAEFVYASDVIIRTSLARLFMLKHKTAFLIYREWWSFYLLMSSAFKKSRAKQHTELQ